MSEVSTIPALASLYAPTGDPQPVDGSELGENAFLKLLTTQLQNQDPTNPVQNEDFVAQLAQFASLEQLTTVNGTLEGVYAALAAMNNASMASLLGTDVIVRGDRFAYDGEGEVALPYSSPADAASATLTVRAEDGTVVWTGDAGAITSGEGTVTWPGTDTTGAPAGEGTYTFEVVAFDANGDTIDIEERITGTIDEMDYSTGSPQPSIDGIVFDIGDILSLTDPGA